MMPRQKEHAIPSSVFGSDMCVVRLDDTTLKGELPVHLKLFGRTTKESVSISLEAISKMTMPRYYKDVPRLIEGMIFVVIGYVILADAFRGSGANLYASALFGAIIICLGAGFLISAWGVTMTISSAGEQDLVTVCPQKGDQSLAALYDDLETRRRKNTRLEVRSA